MSIGPAAEGFMDPLAYGLRLKPKHAYRPLIMTLISEHIAAMGTNIAGVG